MSPPAPTIIPITHYQIRMRALEDGFISGFMGHTLHGALGHSIRRALCNDYRPGNQTECSTCNCLYQPWYNPAQSPDPMVAKRYKDPPRPYFIGCNFDWEKRRVSYDDVLEWTLHVAGNSPGDMNQIVEIVEALCANGLGSGELKWELDIVLAHETTLLLDWGYTDNNFQHITIDFKTPFWTNDKQMQESGTITFDMLLRYAIERIRAMALYYGNAVLPQEEFIQETLDLAQGAGIVEQRLRKWSIDRDRGYPLKGWTGRIRYDRVPNTAINVLNAAQHLHLGRNTTFGCGMIEIQPFFKKDDNTVRRRKPRKLPPVDE